MANIDIYQTVTDRILESLKQGTVPWRNPIQHAGDDNGLPKSLKSGRHYRGVNIFLLAMTAWAKGYKSNYWLTIRQANAMGGQVLKGEKSTAIVFWKRYEAIDPDSNDKQIFPVLRQYSVFNLEQCKGIQSPEPEEPAKDIPTFIPIEAAEKIVSNCPRPPTIKHTGNQAVYKAKADTVEIAKPERFENRESYYATLFHELAHATGHSTRLDRGMDTQPKAFGKPDYCKEELIAEMGSAFLAAHAGISPPTIEQSAAYIAGWHKLLKSDKKLLIQAAAAGQRASDHILDVTWEHPNESTHKQSPTQLPAQQRTRSR